MRDLLAIRKAAQDKPEKSAKPIEVSAVRSLASLREKAAAQAENWLGPLLQQDSAQVVKVVLSGEEKSVSMSAKKIAKFHRDMVEVKRHELAELQLEIDKKKGDYELAGGDIVKKAKEEAGLLVSQAKKIRQQAESAQRELESAYQNLLEQEKGLHIEKETAQFEQEKADRREKDLDKLEESAERDKSASAEKLKIASGLLDDWLALVGVASDMTRLLTESNEKEQKKFSQSVLIVSETSQLLKKKQAALEDKESGQRKRDERMDERLAWIKDQRAQLEAAIHDPLFKNNG